MRIWWSSQGNANAECDSTFVNEKPVIVFFELPQHTPTLRTMRAVGDLSDHAARVPLQGITLTPISRRAHRLPMPRTNKHQDQAGESTFLPERTNKRSALGVREAVGGTGRGASICCPSLSHVEIAKRHLTAARVAFLSVFVLNSAALRNVAPTSLYAPREWLRC